MLNSCPKKIPCSKKQFIFELSLSQSIKSFLSVLKEQCPKKNQSGEMVLFYACELWGLRKAYLKKNHFYEEQAQSSWQNLKWQNSNLRYSKKRDKDHLARELGRPVSHCLMMSLGFRKAFLVMDWSLPEEQGVEFFESKLSCLKKQFERVYEIEYLNREACFWTRLFSEWKEPMAILKDFQILKSNHSFKDLFLNEIEGLEKSQFRGSLKLPKATTKLGCLEKSQFRGSLKLKDKIYELFYHELRDKQALFYAQDMSKYVALREQWFQSEKMLDLFKLGQNMAHQLNNPLTGVRAMTQILSQKPKLKTFEREWKELEKAIDRSQQIIKSFLSFSERSKNFRSCDLNQVIGDSLPLLKSMTKRISLVKKLHAGELRVKGSLALFQQIVYNLMLNACQSLLEDEQNIKPELILLTEKLSGDCVCMKVIDNGKGIPQNNLDKIFKPLWTSRKNGTGFGLGITKKIVQKYGGTISVSSKTGRTCFTVTLPLHCPENLLEMIDSA